MLIRAGRAVRASVVFALVLLYTCQPGCWDCRRSCVRDWSSPVCWSEVDTTFPTAGSPAFLFHLRQYRTSRANEPLLSGVVSESCFVIRDNPECCASRIKIKRSKYRCAYYSKSTATFQCLLQGDLVFKLNPGPTGDQSTIHAHCSVTRRRVPLSTRTRNHSNLNTVKRAPTTKHFNTPILEQQDNRAFQLCSLNARSLRNKSTAFVDLVCDLRAELFTICESWLHDLDSAILSELTLPTHSSQLFEALPLSSC